MSPRSSSPKTISWPTTSSRPRSSSRPLANGSRPAKNRIQTEVSTRTIRLPYGFAAAPSGGARRGRVARHHEAHVTVHRRRDGRAPRGRVEQFPCRCWHGMQLWHVEVAHRRCAASSSYALYYHTLMACLSISLPVKPLRRTGPVHSRVEARPAVAARLDGKALTRHASNRALSVVPTLSRRHYTRRLDSRLGP